MEIKKFIFFIITIILEILQKWQIKFQQFFSTIKLLFTKFLEIDKYSQTTESIRRFSLAIKIYISILSWIFEVSLDEEKKKEIDSTHPIQEKEGCRFSARFAESVIRWRDGGGRYLSKRITSDATSRDKVAWVSFVITDRASSYVRLPPQVLALPSSQPNRDALTQCLPTFLDRSTTLLCDSQINSWLLSLSLLW